MDDSRKEFCEKQRNKIVVKLEIFQEELKEYGELPSEEHLILINKYSHKIKILKEALFRIEKGDYGICRYCHKNIGQARLSMVPETELCLQCAKNNQ